MQPFRFLVMAAKVPLIPAGIAGYTVGAAAYGLEVPDFGPAFENFDPGPAIDADLERMEHEARNDAQGRIPSIPSEHAAADLQRKTRFIRETLWHRRNRHERIAKGPRCRCHSLPPPPDVPRPNPHPGHCRIESDCCQDSTGAGS